MEALLAIQRAISNRKPPQAPWDGIPWAST